MGKQASVLQPTRQSGELCELASGDSGHSPSKNAFWRILRQWHAPFARPFCGIFTGCRSDSRSRLRQPFWFTSANTAWLRSTYKPTAKTASRCQHAPAVVFDPSVPVFWLFNAREQTTAIVVLPCMDLVCGTVFLMNWDHLTLLWLRSETNWRRYYLTCSCFFSAFVVSCESALYKCA